FPDTYQITKYTSMDELVKLMVAKFEVAYAEVLSGKNKVDMEKHQHVTFASIVEKETGAAEERAVIASVFHNRLKKKMRLQSDPTIIYGHWAKTGEYLKNIRKMHIMSSTDHNTYTIKALPIGPVSNPGKEAMVAALNP